jgi:1,4-dihydroxy-2-naphthoate octaprenyltransferase
LLHYLLNWLRAWRLPAQLNLVFPALLGLLLCAPCGTPIGDLPLGQALAFSLLLQWVIMTSNEAADAETDDASTRTLISGGAGVGAQGALSPRALRQGAVAGAALGLMASAVMGGPAMALAWLAALMLIWAYDGPLRLSRHPLGAGCQALGVGIVMPMLIGWLVAPWHWPSVADAVLGLVLGLCGHLLTALPDEAIDRRVGKVTLAVKLGPSAARKLMLGGFALAAGWLALGLPSSPCGARQVPMPPAEQGLLAISVCLLALAAMPRPWASKALAGLPRYLWSTALASIMLWSVWLLQVHRAH